MITAILTSAVIWFLFYGRVSTVILALCCPILGLTLAFLAGHGHTRFLSIDIMAQISRLNRVNPDFKLWVTLALMVICVSSPGPAAGLFLTLAMSLLTVWAGGLALSNYLRVLAIPASFLAVSGLALLFELTGRPTGVLSFHLFGAWLSVSPATQSRAALVMARALGALSCLYFLSLTTVMSEIIGALRRARCPEVIIDLMYLIYRYIFIMLSMYYTMRDSAKSRLGYADYPTSLRTTGNLYSNLLARSYRQAGRNFDAMESRCYDTGIRFLENTQRITGVQTAVAFGLAACTLGLSLFLR